MHHIEPRLLGPRAFFARCAHDLFDTDHRAHGTVTVKDAGTGAFTFTPNAGYSGEDLFTFVASDGTQFWAAMLENESTLVGIG